MQHRWSVWRSYRGLPAWAWRDLHRSVLLIGLLAEAIGAEQFGNQLIGGVLYLATALAAYMAADVLVQDAVAQIVTGPAASWLHAVRKYPEQVTKYCVLVLPGAAGDRLHHAAARCSAAAAAVMACSRQSA